MSAEWMYLIISAFLFAVITIYDAVYAPFCRKMEFDWSKRQRTVFRNIVYAVLTAFDAAVVILTVNDVSADHEKRVLFYGCLVLGLLHVVNSLLALARHIKLYRAVYVTEFCLRLIAAGILLAIQYFLIGDMRFLYTVAAMYFIISQGIPLLEGTALELRLEDFGGD